MAKLHREILRRFGYAKIQSLPVTRHADEVFADLADWSAGACAFDVGANDGRSTTPLRQQFPEAKVYAFEPVPVEFERLQAAHGKDPMVECLRLGLSDAVGVRTFHINDRPYNHSFLPAAKGAARWVDIDYTGQLDIETTTVDAFCRERGIDRVALLKVDTEGADIHVLRGAGETLRQAKIDLVYVEILPVPTFEGQGNLREFLEFMEERGYALFDFYNARHDDQGRLRLTNALFVSPRVIERQYNSKSG